MNTRLTSLPTWPTRTVVTRTTQGTGKGEGHSRDEAHLI